MPRRLSRRKVLSALAGAALFPALAEARARRRNEAERFDLVCAELRVPGLHPAHDGLRVGQLSDLHVGRNTPDGRVVAAIRQLNGLRPDLVVLTGDYVTTRRDPFERVPLLLQGIRAPTFAVLGNHDHWSDAPRLRRDLERLGYPVLQNAHTTVRVRGAPLTVLGIDDGHTGRDDVARAFKGAPPSGSRLVLAHTPVTADKLPPDEGLVCFSGHTHGGHFVIPGFTDAVLRSVGQPYIRGLYQVRGNALYVNRGLGFGRGGPVLRVSSNPELTVLTLRAA